MVELQQQRRARDLRPTRTSSDVDVVRRRRRQQPVAQHRAACSSTLKPRASAADRDQVIQRAAPEAGATCRHRTSSSSPIQNIRLGGRQSQEPVPVHAAGARHRASSTTGRRRLQSAHARLPGVPRRDQRSAAAQPAGEARHRPRQGQPARHHRRPDPQHALQRLRHPPGVDDLHAGEQLPGDPGGRPERPAIDRRCSRKIYVRASTRPAGAADRASRRSSARRRAGSRSTSGPAAGGHHLVQPRARRLARRRRSTRSSSIERDRLPATRHHQLPGAAQVFQDRSQGQGSCCSARSSSSTSCSACSTRASSTRSRSCPACPSAALGALLTLMLFGIGPERHRHHRHPHADRHREEERDHDDRLRARRAARQRHGRRRDAIREACLCASARS